MTDSASRCLIIAEAGVNHNGAIDMALRLIDAAADAGADTVKFQTFRAEAVVSRFAPKAEYQIDMTGSGESHLWCATIGAGSFVRSNAVIIQGAAVPENAFVQAAALYCQGES